MRIRVCRSMAANETVVHSSELPILVSQAPSNRPKSRECVSERSAEGANTLLAHDPPLSLPFTCWPVALRFLLPIPVDRLDLAGCFLLATRLSSHCHARPRICLYAYYLWICMLSWSHRGPSLDVATRETQAALQERTWTELRAAMRKELVSRSSASNAQTGQFATSDVGAQ